MTFKADLEAMLLSAEDLWGRGETLAVRHLAADNKIGAATPGWAGQSGRALDSRMEAWQSRTRSLVSRIGEHSAAVHACANTFSAHEQQAGTALALQRPSYRP